MTLSRLFALIMALAAYSCIAGGELLMKKGIGWLGWQGPRKPEFLYYRRLWLTGLVLANLYGIPSAVALAGLPAHVVGAFSGWTVVLLALFSHRFLNERLSARDLLHGFLFAAGIVVLNLLDKPGTAVLPSMVALAVFSLVPVALTAVGGLLIANRRWKTMAFGAAAGMSTGLMVVFLRLLVQEHQFALGRYLSSPSLYLYIFFALLALVALQLALKNGGMILTAAMKYAAAILTPMACAPLVFGIPISPYQWAAAAVMVYAVTGLVRDR